MVNTLSVNINVLIKQKQEFKKIRLSSTIFLYKIEEKTLLNKNPRTH